MLLKPSGMLTLCGVFSKAISPVFIEFPFASSVCLVIVIQGYIILIGKLLIVF